MSANCREGTPPGKAQVGAWAPLVDGGRELSYFQDSWGWLFIILLLKIELSFEITFDRNPGHFA